MVRQRSWRRVLLIIRHSFSGIGAVIHRICYWIRLLHSSLIDSALQTAIARIRTFLGTPLPLAIGMVSHGNLTVATNARMISWWPIVGHSEVEKTLSSNSACELCARMENAAVFDWRNISGCICTRIQCLHRRCNLVGCLGLTGECACVPYLRRLGLTSFETSLYWHRHIKVGDVAFPRFYLCGWAMVRLLSSATEHFPQTLSPKLS